MAKKLRRSPGKHHVVVRDGVVLELRKHPTKFIAHCTPADIHAQKFGEQILIRAQSKTISMVSCKNSDARNSLMRKLREKFLVHHVYIEVNTRQTVVLGDEVLAHLAPPREESRAYVCNKFSLKYTTSLGDTDILQLTKETGMNPLKIAKQLRSLECVQDCTPELLMQTSRSNHALFNSQWHLADANRQDWDGQLGTLNYSIAAERAWRVTTGSSEVVVAVMDDGFDLNHPAFQAQGKLHPEPHNFINQSSDVGPDNSDYHGTPVASLAVSGTHEISGVAPGCRLLPLKVDPQIISAATVFKVIRYASERADVLNISLEMIPQGFKHEILLEGPLQELEEITRRGGRRKKGLVIVVSAGNSDLPIRLSGDQNKIRRKFRWKNSNERISAGTNIFTGYPNWPGVIVVSSATAFLQKAGYSNWGREITVAAPSDNANPMKQPSHDFAGAKVVTAVNRAPPGKALDPDPEKTQYTRDFGGTSAAAPIVAGVAALIISINPDLEGWEVRRIIESTAFKGLDTTVDTGREPNLRWASNQPVDGEFQNGRSLLFGYGRVNAARAVERAVAYRDLIDGEIKKEGHFSNTEFTVEAGDVRGVSKALRLAPDDIQEISLTIKGSHLAPSRFRFTLITPDGYVASFSPGGAGTGFFSLEISSDHHEALARLTSKPINGNGHWKMNVQNVDSDNPGTISEMHIRVA